MTDDAEHPETLVADAEGEASAAGTPLERVLHRLLGRTPSQRTLDFWSERLARGMKASKFVELIAQNKAFLANKPVRGVYPPGHFFSPVVDPDTVGDYHARSHATTHEEIAGIDFRLDDMVAFWTRNRDFIAGTPFGDAPSEAHRYWYGAGPYWQGDAVTLRAMIGHHRPRRIVEIGSGSTTACMLDSAEHAGLDGLQLTCIEPFPARLKRLVRESDLSRMRILEQGVQGVDLDIFRELERDDVLFIDSTHVLKTGSDVHYQMFSILPVLKPGVIIHWHDVRFPFEYSRTQVFEKNYSWNEAYAVRLLLMYSERFRIIFYGSLFARLYPKLIREAYPLYLRNPGSALWARVEG